MDATLNQAIGMANQGNYGAAIDAYTKLLAADEQSLDAMLGLADVYLQVAEAALAKPHLDRALELAGDNERALTLSGVASAKLGDTDRALEFYRKALEVNPESMHIKRLIADMHRLRGDYREAYDLLKPDVDSGDADINMMLAYARVAHRFDGLDESIEIAAEVTEYEGVPAHFIWTAGFLLGSLLDQAGRFDEAFAAYARANALRRTPFEVEPQTKRFRECSRVWTKEAAQAIRDSGNTTERPVFVIGMPRSGTTLVERIIGSHPDAFAGGERQEVSTLANEIAKDIGNFTADPSVFDRVDLAGEAERIDGIFQSVAPGALRVVDKLPLNTLRLPLIRALFPRARVIRMRRDPRDTCLSCFFQPFTGHHPYAYDLRDLGLYSRAYESLATHYCSVLGLETIDVEYEAVVADQEGESRRIIDFIGLDWHDDCLRYDQIGGTSVTASTEQVRKPIYRSSVARWKNYEPHLGPLFEALETGASG